MYLLSDPNDASNRPLFPNAPYALRENECYDPSEASRKPLPDKESIGDARRGRRETAADWTTIPGARIGPETLPGAWADAWPVSSRSMRR